MAPLCEAAAARIVPDLLRAFGEARRHQPGIMLDMVGDARYGTTSPT